MKHAYSEVLMKAIIIGAVVIFTAILAILPSGLGWGGDVMAFLRGALPVLALLIGLVLLFAGVSDIKERRDAKKEEAGSV